MRKNNNPQANDFEIELPAPFSKPKNISVYDDQQRNIAILKVYGEIDEPSEYIDELSKLNTLSGQYDVIEITLNSPGGSLNTAVDLASIINNFQHVVTIGKGEVASAAFMIWTMGNIKVVTDYSMYMAHRESYGMYGKTSEHKAAAHVFGEVYEELFEECFGEILNENEKIIAERSEAWVSYRDLLTRPGVISYDEYISPRNPYTVMDTYISSDGKMFMYDMETDAYRTIKVKFGDEVISDMTDYLYGISTITKLPKPKKVKKPKKSKNNVKLSKDKKKKKDS